MVNVPALVSEDLFAAVQAQLKENRLRKRGQSSGDRYLLQGLVLCKRCGYACSGNGGNSGRDAIAKGKTPYAYYRCAGSDPFRFGGQRLCWNKAVRTDFLDAAVWDDVRSLLAEPDRIRVEYQRRLERKNPDRDRELTQVAKLISQVRKSISRLIDAYGDGMLAKSEFEPRITAARERLSRLEAEQKQTAAQAGEESELRLAIGRLEEFAKRVSESLEQPTWATKREIVRALVKQIEIDEGEVRIVYRVSPAPRNGGPKTGRLQGCSGRVCAAWREILFAYFVPFAYWVCDDWSLPARTKPAASTTAGGRSVGTAVRVLSILETHFDPGLGNRQGLPGLIAGRASHASALRASNARTLGTSSVGMAIRVMSSASCAASMTTKGCGRQTANRHSAYRPRFSGNGDSAPGILQRTTDN